MSLEQKIEEYRQKLHDAMNRINEIGYEKVVEVSQELDVLITLSYKNEQAVT